MSGLPRCRQASSREEPSLTQCHCATRGWTWLSGLQSVADSCFAYLVICWTCLQSQLDIHVNHKTAVWYSRLPHTGEATVDALIQSSTVWFVDVFPLINLLITLLKLETGSCARGDGGGTRVAQEVMVQSDAPDWNKTYTS